MAGFNPVTINFNYPKNQGMTPNMVVEATFPEPVALGLLEILHADWLDVSIQGYDPPSPSGPLPAITKVIMNVSVNTAMANNMSNGFYSENFRVRSNNIDPFNFHTITLTTLSTLQVFEFVPLSISPHLFSAVSNVGDANPPPKFLSITTDSAWSAQTNQSWMTFSQYNGSGNLTIQVFADISALAPGWYSADFLVDDGHTTQTGMYVVQITGSGTEDHLALYPESVVFSETLNQPPASSQTVTIDSTLPVTIDTETPWLQVSTGFFPDAGVNDFTINTFNTELMEVGTYPGQVTVQSDYGVKIVNVALVIVEEAATGLQTSGFYFAHARNRLNMTTARNDAEVSLAFVTDASMGQKRYRRKVPYYNNTLSVVIGLETEILLEPFDLPDPLITGFYVPLRPIRMELNVFDTEIGGISLWPRGHFQDMKFINGKNPRTALAPFFDQDDIYESGQTFIGQEGDITTQQKYRLTALPKKVYVPNDGMVSFSFYSDEGAPPAQISVLQVGADLPSSTQINPNPAEGTDRIFSCVMKMADLDFPVGSRLTVTCGIVNFVIVLTQPLYPTAQLIWLNQWDCPEIFNLTGKVEIADEDESDTETLSRDGTDYTSVIEIKEPKSFKVNTGKIFTEEEVKFLAGVLRAKKIWLQIAGRRYEVIKNFDDLPIFETRRFFTDFALKFDSATK